MARSKREFKIYWYGKRGILVLYDPATNEALTIHEKECRIVENMICAGALKRKWKNGQPSYFIKPKYWEGR